MLFTGTYKKKFGELKYCFYICTKQNKMDSKRAAQVYQAYKQKTSKVLQDIEVRKLRNRVLELEMENKILRNLLGDQKNDS